MQKRGTGRRHNSADNLTFTKGDDLSSARRRPESSSSKSFSTTRGLRGATKAHPHFLQIVGCILVVGIVLGGILWVVHHPKAPAETAVSSHTRRTNTRALSQFSSLDSAFAASSSLVLLYFAAAWCPVSTPATENIEEYLSDHLAPPPPISIKPPPILPVQPQLRPRNTLSRWSIFRVIRRKKPLTTVWGQIGWLCPGTRRNEPN